MKPAWRGTILVHRTMVPATANVHLKRRVSESVGRMIAEEWTHFFKRAKDIISVELHFGPMSVRVLMRLLPLGRNPWGTDSKTAECKTGFCTGCLHWFKIVEGHPDNECPVGTVYAVLSS